MFHSHIERLSARIHTIRCAVKSADMVRALLAEPAFDPSILPAGSGQVAGQWLRTHAPTTVAWKEFDHNAATTALYAAYESSVYDLLRDWIANYLPIRWPKYRDDLPESIRAAYVGGIAKILPELGKGRYHHLNVKDVAHDFANTTAGNQPYRLHHDAFFTNDQNLRSGRLNDLLKSVGLEEAWSWVCRHPQLIDYVDNVIGGGNSLESELSRFVQARNEAAHGFTGAYLGISQLEQLSVLAERIGIAVVEKARHDMCQHLLATNQAESLGVVTKVLPKANAVIMQASGRWVTVGEPLGLLCTNCCDFQSLHNCRADNVDHATLVPTEGQELGLQFAKLPREGAQVIRILPAAVASSTAAPPGTAQESMPA